MKIVSHSQKEGISQYQAVLDDKVIGWISFKPASGEIVHIEVLPEFRRQGVGKRLVHYIISRITPPILSVDTDDCEFFQGCGFNCEKSGDHYHCYKVKTLKRCC